MVFSGAEYEGYIYKDFYSDAEPGGKIDGEEMMSNIIDWVSDKHWDRQSLLECGWLETVDLDDIGKVRAKFDTGNGAKACAFMPMKLRRKEKISYGNMMVKPKNLKHGKSEVFRANADGKRSEIRPTVLLDLTFNGFTYPDVEVD